MRRFMTLALSILLIACNLTAQQTTTTSVPNLIRYSGTLKDAQGSAAVAPATVGVTFAIYRQQEGGAPVWQETQNVTPDASGQYTVLLGNTTVKGLPGDLFSQQEERWLGVQVQGQAEQPRSLLVSVPYAFKAGEADTLGGLPASAFVKATPADGSSSTTLTTGAIGNPNTAKSSVGIDTVVNCASAKNNYIPLFTQAAPPNITICNSVIYQLNGNIGIGTTTPQNALEVAGGRIRVSDPSSGNNGQIFTASSGGLVATHVGSGTNIPLAFFTNLSGPRMIIDTSGNVGIGTTTPILKLDVNGVVNTSATYSIGGYPVASIGSLPDDNLFLGVGAGVHNVEGSGIYNVFSGNQAGYSNTTGTANTFSGQQAGYRNTTASYNTFSGVASGFGNTTGSRNTFYGAFAGLNSSTPSDNTFVGFNAGANNTADWNTFFGSGAGTSNTTGNANTFTGYQAGYSNTIGYNNLFEGYEAGAQNTSGYNNVFEGIFAGYSNTTGVGNVFVGDGAGFGNTTGARNTFYGASAGLNSSTPSDNTFVGFNAGANNTADWNTFFGSGAGISNTSGNANTFTGYQAGYSNTIGYNNLFEGYEAGAQNTSGYNNVFEGILAGYSNTTGVGNVFVGDGAGNTNTSGYGNIYIGAGAGSENPSGSFNIYLGSGGFPESDTIRIGITGEVFTTYIDGIYNNPVSGSAVCVTSDSQLGLCGGSSLRFKEQVRDMGDSSISLMKLRPVTFFYKPEYDKGPRRLQYGLIAEEVAEVYPELVDYDTDGKPYAVRYQYLSTMLLNEVQKQAAVIHSQQQEIENLKQQLQLQNAGMQQRLSRLEKMVGTQVQTVAQK